MKWNDMAANINLNIGKKQHWLFKNNDADNNSKKTAMTMVKQVGKDANKDI